MVLSEYFENAKGIGVLATSDADGNVNLAIYARPYIISEETIAFSMLERRSFKNIQSNPKAAYMFVEETEGYKGKRLYLTKSGEETDPERIQHRVGGKASRIFQGNRNQTACRRRMKLKPLEDKK